MTVVEAYKLFDRERKPFVQAAPGTRDVRLVIHRKHYLKRPVKRDLAWYEPDTRTINIIAKVLTFKPVQVAALIRHEFGHAIDRQIDRPNSEQRADDLARWVTGEPIYYDGDDIQTLDEEAYPRPGHLPK